MGEVVCEQWGAVEQQMPPCLNVFCAYPSIAAESSSDETSEVKRSRNTSGECGGCVREVDYLCLCCRCLPQLR